MSVFVLENLSIPEQNCSSSPLKLQNFFFRTYAVGTKTDTVPPACGGIKGGISPCLRGDKGGLFTILRESYSFHFGFRLSFQWKSVIINIINLKIRQ